MSKQSIIPPETKIAARPAHAAIGPVRSAVKKVHMAPLMSGTAARFAKIP